MIGLIRKIILATCDPNHDCTGDTKRETNLKNEMEIVRKDDLTVSIKIHIDLCVLRSVHIIFVFRHHVQHFSSG